MSNLSSVDTISYLIHTRRSTKPRRYNGQSINDEIVWTILESARWAPTHGLTQPWFFKVYTGDGLAVLAEFQSSWYKNTISVEKFNPRKFERLNSNIFNSSHVIVLCMKRQPSESIPEVEEVEAIACAVQNMTLMATAYGICTFWGSGGPTYTDAMKTFLGLGERDRCLGYLYLGYSDTPSTQSIRNSIREKVEWISTK